MEEDKMRKPILIIGLFVAIATIALVYATQTPATSTVQPPGTKFITVPVTGSNSEGNVRFDWKLANSYLMLNSAGDAYLDLRITGKNLPGNGNRKPMNLVLVIDRSGSMADENKLEQVKEAAVAMLNQMNASDRLGIVIYDDYVQTVLAPSPVENKSRVRDIIYGLSSGGSTNLCGGLQQGFEEVKKHFLKDSVNRVVLLSDGLANVGITDPEQIAAVARQIRERSVSVSAMGVGIDYNETLMANIADHSGGNYYYISKDVNMADIFRREWNLMQNVIANKATARFDLGSGVEVIDVAGFKWSLSGRKLQIEVPDIYSGETKRIMVHLRAPANEKSKIELARGEFTYTEINGKEPETFSRIFSPTIEVVGDRAVVASNVDQEVSAKVASVEASKQMDEAYQRWEAGDQAGAYELANTANEKLKALGYTQNQSQVFRYDSFVSGMSKPEAQAPQVKKDMLKRQKEAERKAQQSVAQ